MNITNNKTSLYDSVKKNDKINMERKNIKNSLDTIPRGEILTILGKEDEVADVDKSPAEEETIVPSDKKKCIIDKAIENKISHNIKVAKDILDNTLPYYVINDKIEHLVRTTDKTLKRDINNFNYFTNKEDVDEAIRRVKETLMNFQEEIQNRK